MHAKILANDAIQKLTKNLLGTIKKTLEDQGTIVELRYLLRRGHNHILRIMQNMKMLVKRKLGYSKKLS